MSSPIAGMDAPNIDALKVLCGSPTGNMVKDHPVACSTQSNPEEAVREDHAEKVVDNPFKNDTNDDDWEDPGLMSVSLDNDKENQPEKLPRWPQHDPSATPRVKKHLGTTVTTNDYSNCRYGYGRQRKHGQVEEYCEGRSDFVPRPGACCRSDSRITGL